MRKKFILLIIAALVMCLFSSPAFAAKSMFYADNPSSVAVASGATLNTGTALVTGQCNVQSITVSGLATAKEYVLVYDAITATGTAKYDITVGTAYDTVHLPLHDAEFGTGVFVDGVTALDYGHVSLEYTQ